MPDYGMSALLKGIREGSALRRLQPIEETAAEVAARQRAAVPPPAPPEPMPLKAPEALNVPPQAPAPDLPPVGTKPELDDVHRARTQRGPDPRRG